MILGVEWGVDSDDAVRRVLSRGGASNDLLIRLEASLNRAGPLIEASGLTVPVSIHPAANAILPLP